MWLCKEALECQVKKAGLCLGGRKLWDYLIFKMFGAEGLYGFICLLVCLIPLIMMTLHVMDPGLSSCTISLNSYV